MKKFLYFFLALFTMVSCASNEEVLPEVTAESRAGVTEVVPSDNFGIFDFYGEIHNTMLDFVDKKFVSPTLRPATQNGRIDLFLSLQADWVYELPLSERDCENLKTELYVYKDYLITDRLRDNILGVQPQSLDSEDDIVSFDTMEYYRSLYKAGIIEERELKIFTDLYKHFKNHAEGTMSDIELEANVDSLIVTWKNNYSEVNYSCLKISKSSDGIKYLDVPAHIFNHNEIPAGAISGIVLNISKHSLSYWNGPQSPGKVERIAPWVAADGVGALKGAGWTLLYHFVTNTQIDWGSVGWGALSGAIEGSLGVFGKVGRYL